MVDGMDMATFKGVGAKRVAVGSSAAAVAITMGAVVVRVGVQAVRRNRKMIGKCFINFDFGVHQLAGSGLEWFGVNQLAGWG